MPSPRTAWDRFAVLDSLIVRALAELRAARRAGGTTSDRANLALQTGAEANRTALLGYRHAAECREAVFADGRARLQLGARR